MLGWLPSTQLEDLEDLKKLRKRSSSWLKMILLQV